MASFSEIAPGFWNFRSSFKILLFVNIGTHCSLVKLSSGKYVLLDAIQLNPDQLSAINRITNGGADLEACINVHPFHTVYLPFIHETFPQCKMFGTKRHHEVNKDVKFEPELVESEEFHKKYSADFDFSVPRGVLFVHPNPKVHFSSVLVYHRNSKTLHVDDTFNFFRAGWPLNVFVKTDKVQVHPTLKDALERRKGAAHAYRDWVKEIASNWPIDNFLSAHNAGCSKKDFKDAEEGVINNQILDALKDVEKVLSNHENTYEAKL